MLCPGLDSTDRATKILATDLTNLLMTFFASVCLTRSWVVVWSCLIMVTSSVSSISTEHFTSKQWVNLSRSAVPEIRNNLEGLISETE